MVTSIVSAITDAFTGLLSGLGSGIVGFFDDIFVTTSSSGTTTISNFATYGLVFTGIAFAIWIIRKLTSKVG